jgi:tRNA threonylcarbamoyladenosine biosynthesis protein TsaE
MTSKRGRLPDAAATEALGESLAAALGADGAVITLRGDLGTGKTTFVRGLLRALGYSGRVRSPTYTLVEPYELGGRRIFHVDLYRLRDAGEFGFLGLADVVPVSDLLLVEWPERAAGALPSPDLELLLKYPSDLADGRELQIEATSERGRAVLQQWAFRNLKT